MKYLIIFFIHQSLFAMTGMELAQKVYNRPHSKKTSANGRMVIENQKGQKLERIFKTFRLEKSEGDVKSIIKFTGPEDMKGTAFLTIDHKNKSSDQFIYLPSQKKERRISSSKKNGRFVKSDYYYEDLADRVPSKDTHKMLSDGKYEGTDCYKLESIPVDKHESAYSKKVACIDKKTFIPLHVNLYNKKGELSKELKVKAIEEIDGLLFITQSVLENKEKKSKTILLVNDIKSNDNSIKDSLFSRDQLKL